MLVCVFAYANACVCLKWSVLFYIYYKLALLLLYWFSLGCLLILVAAEILWEEECFLAGQFLTSQKPGHLVACVFEVAE